MVITQPQKASTMGSGFDMKTSLQSKAHLLGTFESIGYHETASHRHKSNNMTHHHIFQKLQSPYERILNGASQTEPEFLSERKHQLSPREQINEFQSQISQTASKVGNLYSNRMLDRTRAVPALTTVATFSSDQFGDFKEIKDPAVKSLVSTKLSPRPQ